MFSDSVLCLGKVLQHPECNEAWKDRVVGVKAEKNNYSDFDDVARGMGSPRQASNRPAADSQGSRTCVCANTLSLGWHMQGGKDELTSCRGTV